MNTQACETEFFGESNVDMIPWDYELRIDVVAIPDVVSVFPNVEETNYLGWVLGVMVSIGSFVAIVNFYIE
ncbi:MAG: hypothetical protein JWO15_3536 [Sphingomonadales bacterium]|nr:hypothetical protein [Sphingomonadales bacterium]